MIGKKNKRHGQNVFPRFFLIFIYAALLSFTFQTYCFASTVTLQWGSSSGATGYKVHYQADSSSQPFQKSMDVQNKTTATISGLDPAHSYYFAVTAYNAEGESAYSNVVSVPALVAPSVSITSPSNNATVSGTVSVTASVSDNVGVSKVEFYVNGSLKATDTSTPYLYSWNTSSLTAGTYTLMAKAYNAANDAGQSSITVKVVKDTTAPSVSLTAPANNATVSGTVTISASASDNIGISKVEFYRNGTLLTATNTSPYSYNWNTMSVANGTYTIYAKAYDSSNNVKQSTSASVTVSNTSSTTTTDKTAPTVSISSPAASAKVKGTVSVNATASDNVGVTKVAFYIDGALKATDTASPYSYSWSTTSATNANHTIYAKAYDAKGNVKQSASVSVTVDNSAPAVSITAPAAGAKVKGTVSVNATASDNAGVTKVEFYIDGALKATDTASPFSYSWSTTSATNANHTIYARAYDAAGNVKQSASVSVTVDNSAPAVSITAPAAGAKVKGTVSVNATASDNAGVTKVAFYIDGALKATDTASPYSYSWNTTYFSTGSHTIYARAYDAAGNVKQSPSVSVTVYR